MNVNKVVYNGNTLVDLTSDTVTADNLASGVTAHAADGSSVTGLLPKVEIDSELSSTSTNPVQNKAVTEAINANKYTLPEAAYGKLGGVYLGYSMTNNATGLKIGGIEHNDGVKKLYQLTFSDDTTITAGGMLSEFTIEGLATEIKGNGLVLSPAGLSGKTGIYSRSGFSDPVQIINASDKQLVGNWTLEQATPTANNGIASKSYVDSKTVTVDTALSTSSTNAVQNKAVATSLNNKADKATTLAGYGITDAKIDNKTITLGGNTITLLTEHQDLSEYAKTADVDAVLATKADDDKVLHNTKNVIPDTTNILFGHESNKSWLGFLGGTNGTDGSSLFLNGANTGDNEAGRFELNSVDANKNVYRLSGESNGSLIWCGKHIVRSVNGTNADKSGNVTLTLPTKTSDLTNDSGYLTQHQSLAGYLKTTDVSKVATSGNYNDLSNKPTIPDVSGKVDKSALATVATSGSYDDLKDKPTIPTVDTALDAFSTNPVQNKVIRSELVKKVDKETLYSGWEMMGSNSSLTWSLTSGDSYYGSINATNYTGTSAKATADGNGDTISTTYAKLASENTWSALQTFNSFKTTTEKYNIAAPITVSGTFTPTHAIEYFTASGNITLDMSVLAYALANNEAIVCTCVISSSTAYALTITGANSIIAVGSSDDIAISNKGTMVNIILRKSNGSSQAKAIVQGMALA